MTPYLAPTAISRLFRPLCGVVLIRTLCPRRSAIVMLALLQVIVMSMARPLVCKLLSAGAARLRLTGTRRPSPWRLPTEAAPFGAANQCAASRS